MNILLMCLLFYSCDRLHSNWREESSHYIFSYSWPDVPCSFHSKSCDHIKFLCLYITPNQPDLANLSRLDYCNAAYSLFGCEVMYYYSVNHYWHEWHVGKLIFWLYRYGELDGNINEFTLTRVFVMVSGTLTQRGFTHAPTTWKARIAFTRWIRKGRKWL